MEVMSSHNLFIKELFQIVLVVEVILLLKNQISKAYIHISITNTENQIITMMFFHLSSIIRIFLTLRFKSIKQNDLFRFGTAH